MRYAYIPTVGLSPWLPQLTLRLKAGGVFPVTMCNGTDEDCDNIFNVTGIQPQRFPGLGLYEVWNMAMEESFPDPCPILNDDILISANSVLDAMDYFEHNDRAGIVGWNPDPPTSEPEWRSVQGAYRQSGITGFAFVARTDAFIRCDRRFGWWCGDDDLVYTFLSQGYSAIKMMHHHAEHHSSTSSSQRPEVLATTGDDKQLLIAKWGARSGW